METEGLYLRSYKAGDGWMYFAASQRNQEHLKEFESSNVLMSLKNEEHAEAIVRELASVGSLSFTFSLDSLRKRLKNVRDSCM